MIASILAVLLGLAPLYPQVPLSRAFPREDVKQLIDNERVTVWEGTLTKGQKTPLHQHAYDMVVVELSDAMVRVTGQGSTAISTRRVGQVGFTKKGGSDIQEAVSDVPRHAIFIDLKDVSVAPSANTSAFPPAFPRDGARKILDNARVIVWDYSFTPGKPTPMHFHDKDVVAVFLSGDATSSTAPDGVTTVSPHFRGEARFNARNRTHSELLPSGSQRVIAVELK